MSRKLESQYKTYKSDAAPFFFYLDVIPLDLSQYEIKHHVELLKKIQFNPIMPLPLRVDRVNNGVFSTLLRPRNPISFSIGEKYTAVINPTPFVQYGIEKLINFTEIRASEQFAISLSSEKVRKWWSATRFLYGKLKTLEEDFAAFLRAYLHHIIGAKLEEEDLISASIKYCELIRDICYQRIQEKHILVEVEDEEKLVDMYKMKEGRVQKKRFKFSKEKLLYPSFIDIEVINTRNIEYSQIYKDQYEVLKKNSKLLKYIPLLFYDDLLECMLQNLKTLENYEGKILDPSFLLENKIILLIDKNKSLSNQLAEYTWLNNFNEIDIAQLMKSFEPTFPYDLR